MDERIREWLYEHRVLIGAALASAVVIIALLSGTSAHEAPSGWQYDPYCCSGMDCAPIDQELPDGTFVTKHGQAKLDPDTRKLPSGDEKTHACIYGGRLRCLYKPFEG